MCNDKKLKTEGFGEIVHSRTGRGKGGGGGVLPNTVTRKHQFPEACSGGMTRIHSPFWRYQRVRFLKVQQFGIIKNNMSSAGLVQPNQSIKNFI